MNRRIVLSAAAAAPLLRVMPARAASSTDGSAPAARRVELTTRVVLPDAPGPAHLWLPLGQTAGGYQEALRLNWQATGEARLLRDDVYGAEVLRVVWSGTEGAPRTVEAVQVVTTRDRGPAEARPPALTEAERRFWTRGTEDIPTDGIVAETATRIIGGRTAPQERLRALYDWVVDTTWRNADTPGCGTGDVRAMLEGGRYGGKCADINGLMTALARAAGFPARDVYGVRVAGSRLFPSLGRTGGNITTAQHCRSEAWLDGTGWFPLDPADVRKAMLEDKLVLDSAAGQALRDRLFGAWEMNWVGYNSATGIQLPGASARQRANFAFLMYPCAFVGEGQQDCLDPASFRYEMTARPLDA